VNGGRGRRGRRPVAGRALAAGAVLAGLLAVTDHGPAGAEAVPRDRFAGRATASAIHVDAERGSGGSPRLVGVDVASAAAAIDSGGLGRPMSDETGRVVQPAGGRGTRTYGRGAGLEAAVLRSAVHIAAAGVSEAEAPPTGRPTQEVGPVRLGPIAFASLVRGRAAPDWSATGCVIGRPLSSALGAIVDAQLLGRGPDRPDGQLTSPVLATGGAEGSGRAVTVSESVEYLEPGADDSFALVSESRQSFAPVTLFGGTPSELTVELLGEFVLRATASGRPGGAHVEYAPAGDPTPTTPVLRLIQRGRSTEFTYQQIFGRAGFSLAVDPLVRLAVAEHARQAVRPGGQGDPASQPQESPDGTLAAAAVDVVRVTVLDQPIAGAARALDVRIGHMEVAAAVPAGGVTCRLPVHKSDDPTFVVAGGTFTWTISIPSRADALDGMSCDLVDIAAVDTATATTGVRFRITAASAGGVIDGRRVTWPGLGRYHPGDPPIVVTVGGRVEPDSEAGTLHDTVVVAAGLAGCAGSGPAGSGRAPAGLEGVHLGGSFTLRGPTTGLPDRASRTWPPRWSSSTGPSSTSPPLSRS